MATTNKKNVTASDPNRPVPVNDPALDSFLQRLHLKTKDNTTNKAAVEGYLKNFEADKRNLADTDEATADRRKEAKTFTNAYYDLCTDFYEYGWGQSFHFARMYKDTSFAGNLARHENYLALKLGLQSGMRCIDVGCGIGGPMREIAKFSGAHVTGLNNNGYQVNRCNILAEKAGLSNLCRAVQGDFCNIPFPDSSFDRAYAIEATCHAPTLEDVYGEVFRILKPGGYFAAYEWCTTERYDESNLAMKKIIHLVEEGNAIAKFYTIPQCKQALRNVGFEIIECEDLADPSNNMKDAMNPWYSALLGDYSLDFTKITRTPIGRTITDTFVWVLEGLRLAPAGTSKVSKLLNSAADNLVLAGKESGGIFTPMFYFLVRKPEGPLVAA
ncbi:Delta(24)-sterol C-methyltransferase [Chytridiales sp. JEL 0842]|nr:Delta(24)-sterol C-methyltransferase [Chytridiales sp. JEL 0842]